MKAAAAKFALLIGLLAGLGALAWRYNAPMDLLREKVLTVPAALRYPAYILLYTLVSIAPVPARDVVKLTGAFLFGGPVSSLLVFAGEMGATAAAWIMGRTLGKDFVDRILAGRLQSMQSKIAGASWRQIALLRVFPGTPYRFFNYAAPVTDVRPWPLFLGCAVGTLPRTVFFQMLFAWLGDDIARRGTTTFEIFAISILFAAAALGFWFFWTRRKRKTGRAGTKKA